MTRDVGPHQKLGILAIVSAAFFGFTLFAYTAVQQNYRQSANDPQIQLAEDAASAIDAGKAPSAVVPSEIVNIGESLAPFVIVTDESFHVLASSGHLNGQTPLPPASAFQDAKNNTGKDAGPQENRITWEPAAGVRQAAVIIHHAGGYVLASRSLREVENREDQLTTMAEVTALGLVVLAVAAFLVIK